MISPNLRGHIGQALRHHKDPADAARAIAQTLSEVTDGVIRPRQAWVRAQLQPLVEGARDRADGCADRAALSLARDLALANPYGLMEKGYFAQDARVTDWHTAQMAQWA